MNRDESLKIHINPDNRRVSINDPDYQQAWTQAFERTRAEREEEIKVKVESGELEVLTDPSDPKIDTPERAVHFMAHADAEVAMQDWAVKRGIGMIGVTGGHDHGQLIEYVDDPSVPFLEYEVEKAA